MWQFAEAVRGLADGCLELGIPVTGGNVSFYNQTGAAGDPPDPGGRRARRARQRGRPGADGLRPRPAATATAVPARRDARGAVRLGVGLGDARAPRRHAAAGRPGPRAAPRRRCWPRPRGSGTSAPRTTSPTAASPRAWSSPACAAASAPGSRCRSGSTTVRCRSSTCSASPPAGRWSRCRAATRRRSPRSAPSTACRVELIGVTDPTSGALDVHGQFRIGLDELRAVHTATLPRLFGGSEAAQVPGRGRP